MFYNTDISVEDNANRQQSVTKIDEVGEEGNKVAIEQFVVDMD